MADTRKGFASEDPAGLRARLVGAWDGFVDLAHRVDPATPTRLPGWTAREVVLHLGRWDDGQPLQRILDSARADGGGSPPDPDRDSDAVVAAHRDTSWAEILAALQRARDGVDEFMRSPAVAELAERPSTTLLGPLPVATVLNAGAYELAVHALDLGERDDPDVLMAGLSSIADVTGALLTRQGMSARVTAQTPWGGWLMDARPDGWRITPTAPGKVDGVAVYATAADILDTAAGRVFGPTLLAQRRIRMQDLRRFMLIAPIVDAVPGIPGGVALRAAARMMAGAAGLVDRIPGTDRLPGLPNLPGLRRR